MSSTLLTLVLLSAPPAERPEAQLYVRRHHPLKVTRSPAFVNEDFEIEGVLAPDADGSWRLSIPVSRATRQQVADARKLPLAEIPPRVDRRLQIDPSGPAAKDLQAWVGKQVRLRVRRDRSGLSFVTAVLNPRRR